MNDSETSGRTQARQAILAAADELFCERGYDATTTREIADRSGVNKALIHYYFKTKEALFESVLDQYYERLAEVVLGALSSEGTVRDRLHRLLDAYYDFLAANRNFSRIVQRETSSGPLVERAERHVLPLFEAGIAVMLEAQPAFREGPLAASQLLISFYGMLSSYFTYADVITRLVGEDPFSAEAFAQRKAHVHRMLDLVLDAVEREAQGE